MSVRPRFWGVGSDMPDLLLVLTKWTMVPNCRFCLGPCYHRVQPPDVEARFTFVDAGSSGNKKAGFWIIIPAIPNLSMSSLSWFSAMPGVCGCVIMRCSASRLPPKSLKLAHLRMFTKWSRTTHGRA
ncbi:hypothetical protein Nepgr_006744 [Nepenthes gracilis]|uniref:Uncharacterized protein n=1 Tax=Nepenthes gracilis TaxID=150966 RepID=A0AAD3XHN0_NEPGR|nr:hypothetical protein Nepgr_006744 [Nepenthes gracilis]